MMIVRNEKAGTIGIEREDSAIVLGSNQGITIESWRFPGGEPVFDAVKPELLALAIEGETLGVSGWKVESVEADSDDVLEYVGVTAKRDEPSGSFRMKVALAAAATGAINLVIQVAATWQSVPCDLRARFPFLSRLSELPGFNSPAYIGKAAGGRRSLVWGFHETPPFVVTSANGPAIGLHLPSEFPWWSNYNQQVTSIHAVNELRGHEFFIKPTEALTDILDIAIDSSESGWPGVFHAWKERIRSGYDLRKYDSEAVRWCQRTYLHHFTFAYGTEVFNYDTGEIEIDRLLDEGEKFGGYDAVIFWHQYPRLGLDSRTQWDLYDDLPNGRASLAEMSERCHARKTRFLLPFKPWDLRAEESLDDAARQIERLVEEASIDGFFLDTMSSIPASFARLVRERFPSLLFASEGSPREPRQIEQLNSSWDQTGRFGPTVEANLFRFLFPEHPQHMISRWSMGSHKDEMIKRAIFNGAGLVIWQDIFGAWLPYSDQQKRKVARWKEILSQFHDVIFGQESVPLIATEQDGLLCNRFSTVPSKEAVITLCNDLSRRTEGPLVRLPGLQAATCTVLLGDGEARVERENDASLIHGRIEAKEVMAIHLSQAGRT